MENGYFQLEVKNDGTYLVVFPPEGDGFPCDPAEVLRYLDMYRIDYDKIAIYNLMKDYSTKKELRITAIKVSALDETADIEITDNFTVVTARFYPEVKGGKKLTLDEMKWLLDKRGIKNGIKVDVINKYLKERRYNTPYVIAEADPPIEGTDASIEYKFNTDLTQKPKLNEDGSVDFHQLDNLCKVEKDQVLAVLTPAVHGKPGMDVLGRPIAPRKVNVLFLKQSKNARLSPDGTQLISNVNGHAVLAEKQVFVSDTYEIPGNVDVATGDVQYTGNVKIAGNVNTGYKVIADGDIIVDGIVEGAELHAGGQIILKRGIQGMSRGILVAGSNVVAKFIESAEVHAGGYIQTESIMHSNVTARAEIFVTGKKGFATGGVIRAGKCLEAKTAGSVMGTQTIIEVGESMNFAEEERNLMQERRTLMENIEKTDKVLSFIAKKVKDKEPLPKEKIIQFQQLKVSKDSMKKRLDEIENRLDELDAMLENSTKGYVQVDDVIYPGCKITIANVSTYIRTETKHSRLIRDGADIRVTAFL